jgi:hypothetical protein
MTDTKQVCLHYLGGTCKYGEKCIKAHIHSSPEILIEMEKKGTIICNFYPNCVYTSSECKRLHVNARNGGDINDLCMYFFKIVEFNTNNKDKLDQINRIRKLIKHDLDFLKDTYNCLNNL